MQMQNVLVAIGGSGTKVAEALVRLLAIGFPTSRARIEETDVYTSVGDKLLIWRVDTDAGNGASHALQQCVENYNEMQNHLSAEGRPRWGMDIEPQICHLNPLHLPNVDVKIVKNLRGLLDSGAFGKESSKSLLDAFFEPKELEVKIDKGFYQKPFIGAAVDCQFACRATFSGRTTGSTQCLVNRGTCALLSLRQFARRHGCFRCSCTWALPARAKGTE
jgi:hypothetical protein